jgi:hypothetical protein
MLPPIPASSVVVVIESAVPCASESCTGRKFDRNLPQPPFCDLPPRAWADFRSEMQTLVGEYQSEGQAGLAYVCVPFAMLLFHPAFGPVGRLLAARLGYGPAIALLFLVFALAFASGLSLTFNRRKANELVDQRIRALCQRASTAATHFALHTRYTQPCKPNRVQTYRALVVSPGGGMPENPPHIITIGSRTSSTQGAVTQGLPVAVASAVTPEQPRMSVTCPANLGAGDTLQITSPAGQTLNVQIPPGVQAGDAFEVVLPAAAQPVVATVVTATIAS